MPRTIIFALISSGLLSACASVPGGPPPAPVFGGTHSQSIGFTGVGTESAQVNFQRRGVPVGAGLAANTSGRSLVIIKSRQKTRSQQAKVAILHGAKFGAASSEVLVAGQPLSFSLIEVNGTRFGVLNKRPEIFNASMSSQTRSAFAAQLLSLTGCSADGAGYGYGPNRSAPTGIAIPLICG
ncbi:MAG: hypothetical protein ACSHXB_02425 [Sulfitobacter sp.]